MFLFEGDRNSYSFFLITQEIVSPFQLPNHRAEPTSPTVWQVTSCCFQFGLVMLEPTESFGFHRAAAECFEDLKKYLKATKQAKKNTESLIPEETGSFWEMGTQNRRPPKSTVTFQKWRILASNLKVFPWQVRLQFIHSFIISEKYAVRMWEPETEHHGFTSELQEALVWLPWAVWPPGTVQAPFLGPAVRPWICASDAAPGVSPPDCFGIQNLKHPDCSDEGGRVREEMKFPWLSGKFPSKAHFRFGEISWKGRGF